MRVGAEEDVPAVSGRNEFDSPWISDELLPGAISAFWLYRWTSHLSDFVPLKLQGEILFGGTTQNTVAAI